MMQEVQRNRQHGEGRRDLIHFMYTRGATNVDEKRDQANQSMRISVIPNFLPPGFTPDPLVRFTDSCPRVGVPSLVSQGGEFGCGVEFGERTMPNGLTQYGAELSMARLDSGSVAEDGRILFPSYLGVGDPDVFEGRVEVASDGGCDRDDTIGICVLKLGVRTGGRFWNGVEAGAGST